MTMMWGILLLSLGVEAAWSERCTAPIGVRNLAKHGVVSQSSTYVDSVSAAHMGPELAIDGNNDSKYSQGSCSHTKKEYEPWWSLDMKHSHRIGTVVLTIRTDCCQERMLGAEVMVGDSPNGDNPVCGVVQDASQETIAFCCDGMVGRHVTVRIPRSENHLTMCEVEVYEYVETPDVRPEEVVWSE
ncbi:fucolectin-1-like [Hyla sarda]|uniref:fucolectin-1-like n=1 Tax=Hyla sarda TaxID=327740 RepID=UPI0024C27D0C|nr:fucolectin-1-like [Hyla sarda]